MGACSELKYFVYSKVYSFSSVLFGAIIVKIMGQKRAILQPKELKSHTNMFMGGGGESKTTVGSFRCRHSGRYEFTIAGISLG